MAKWVVKRVGNRPVVTRLEDEPKSKASKPKAITKAKASKPKATPKVEAVVAEVEPAVLATAVEPSDD